MCIFLYLCLSVPLLCFRRLASCTKMPPAQNPPRLCRAVVYRPFG